MIRLKFKSFKTRILFFFLTLFALILLATDLLVVLANYSNAHEIIESDLRTASKIFLRLMDTRTGQLADSARLLSGDYAFKTAYATGDRGTIISALENHQARIGSDIMKIVSMEGTLVASTDQRETPGASFGYPALITLAEDQGEAYSLTIFGGDTYQTVVVPLLAPTPIAWIVIGFKINDSIAKDFKRLTNLDVSFFQAEKDGRVRCFASTIPEGSRGPVVEAFKNGWKGAKGDAVEIKIAGDTFISLKTGIGRAPDGAAAHAVLQRSITRMMVPFNRLQENLVAIGLAGLVLAAVAGVVVSRSVTKPVTSLVEGVSRVERGDFSQSVMVAQEDEIGTLGTAINKMTVELAEKDKVRDLLGKVVSHEVADELLRKKVELGGEEREITVMFVDIRGFTTHAEGKNPKEVLSFLNITFTKMSEIIESNGGVVDKYIGDAIMAIFGAPVQHDDDADRALKAALEIIAALDGINTELAGRGFQPLDVGVGVNTGLAVVGNMGSINRLNYTAIGDGVNLASRLQDLTREEKFWAKIIISQRTLSVAKGNYVTRDLGMVTVKGKSQPISIYALSAKAEKSSS